MIDVSSTASFGCWDLARHVVHAAAGLIAAAGALTAAWIAWTAVQQQINAEKERTTADRRDGPRGE